MNELFYQMPQTRDIFSRTPGIWLSFSARTWYPTRRRFVWFQGVQLLGYKLPYFTLVFILL